MKKTFAEKMREKVQAVSKPVSKTAAQKALRKEGQAAAQASISTIIAGIEEAAGKKESSFYYLAGHKCNYPGAIELARIEVAALRKMLTAEGFTVENADFHNVPEAWLEDEWWNIAIRVKW